MRLRALPLAECRREHPEVAIRGAVAGDEVPDHDVRPRMRLELRIDELRCALVAERRTRVSEVRERRKPKRFTKRVQALSRDSLEMLARLALHPQVDEQADQAGPPGSFARSPGEDSQHRRDLAQATLLAPDAEHLDPVGPPGIPAGEQPAPIV